MCFPALCVMTNTELFQHFAFWHFLSARQSFSLQSDAHRAVVLEQQAKITAVMTHVSWTQQGMQNKCPLHHDVSHRNLMCTRTAFDLLPAGNINQSGEIWEIFSSGRERVTKLDTNDAHLSVEACVEVCEVLQNGRVSGGVMVLTFYAHWNLRYTLQSKNVFDNRHSRMKFKEL